MNPDGISYLDIADSIIEHDWRNVVNAHWSPLYPLLLAVFLRVLEPSPAWESALVHLLNYGIYLAALTVFTRFLKRLTDYLPCPAVPSDVSSPPPRTAWYAFGYSVFVLCTLRLIDYHLVTPDLCVALLFVACADLVLTIQQKPDALRYRVLLGIALGLGYLAKAAMFPIALVLLAILPLKIGRKIPSGIAMHVTTVVVFAALAVPWILILSRAQGHVTFSESGKLAYIWSVSHDAALAWSGSLPPGLLHPPKILFYHPMVLGFDGPIPGSYPYWRDPVYWLSGIKPKLHLMQAFLNLLRNLLNGYYYPYLQDYSGLVAGMVCGLWLRLNRVEDQFLKAASVMSVPLVLAAVGFMSYAPFYVEQRYVGGYFLVFFVCAYSTLWLPLQSGGTRSGYSASSLVLATVGLSVLLPVVSSVPQTTARIVSDIVSARFFASYDDLHAAEALARMGCSPGDKLASVGASFYEAPFLRVGRFKSVAEVPDDQVNLFWKLDRQARAQLFKQLSAAGIKAIVADGNSPRAELGTWTKLGTSHFYAHLLASL